MKNFFAQLGIVLILVMASPCISLSAQNLSNANQQPLLSDSGEIRGSVNFCGIQGNDGIVLVLVGRSFMVQTDASGKFFFSYVPAGDHNLRIKVPGYPYVTYIIHVAKHQTTNLGSIDICPDNDGDEYSVDLDCNDNNPLIYPYATEECDGVDNDCNGDVDESCDLCTDDDKDGFPAQLDCPNPRDCDDADNTIFPGATEICDARDNNCDGNTDEDLDGDFDGFTSCGGDCNDTDNSIHPEAQEECDGVDNNCDQNVDEGFDGDNDGFTSCNGDCNDGDDSIHPNAIEVCDGLDNNCSGDIDEGCVSDNDGDGDGFGADADCDDTNAKIYPGAPELCDGLDNSCSGSMSPEEYDNDADGYVECIIDELGWNGANPILGGNDCDDTHSAAYPNALEVCDGIDNDCNGIADEGVDLFSDLSNCGSCGTQCSSGAECVAGACVVTNDECNGSDLTLEQQCFLHGPLGNECEGVQLCTQTGWGTCLVPVEMCDGIDNNCDGQVDEGCTNWVCSSEEMGQYRCTDDALEFCAEGEWKLVGSCNDLNPCAADFDCPSDQACTGLGFCSTNCLNDADCQNYETCNAQGFCILQ